MNTRVTLTGKFKGEFNGKSYYRLYFSETIDEVEGYIPARFKRANGIVSYVACDEATFNSHELGYNILKEDILFDAFGKVVFIETPGY